MEPPYPGHSGSGVERVPTGEDDLGPTGEHDSPVLELSGSDLEPVASEPPLDPVQTPVLAPDEDGPTVQPGPAGQLFGTHGAPGPFERTLPPTPRFEPVGDDPLDSLEPLDNAPTRIEREEDILANIDGAPQQVAGPRLLIIGGNNRGREFTLKAADNSIGRGTDNDVVLADIAVSRKHTLVCYETDHFVVRDLGSGNGTLLNGKKVTNHPLQDGDQLELGNTLMRFLCPATPALAHMSTAITHREELPGGAQHTMDVRPQMVTITARPTDAGLFSSRSRKLLVFGGVGLVVFLGAMIGLKVMLSSKRQQAAAAAKTAGPKPDEILMVEFNEGIKQYNARNWAEARLHFQKVLALAPNQPTIRHYIEVTETEQTARAALDKARGLLAARRYAEARKEVAKVRTTSSYQSDSRALQQKIDDDQVTQLLETARALRGTDASAALDKVKEALAVSPANQAVRDLYDELSKARSKVAVKTKPEPVVRPEPKRRPEPKHKAVAHHKPEPRAKPEPKTPDKAIKVSGNAAKNAIAQYKKKQWGPAHQMLKEFAATQKGKKQKSTLSLAEAVRQVGQAWTRAEQVENSNPTQALRYYEDAAKADLKIEKGVHQKVLREKLFKVAKAKATTALQRKQNAAAYDAVKVAEKYGKRDASIQTVLDTLQKRAQALFDQAYTMRSNGNINGARKLWQQILHMVPPSSPVYKKSYDWLNSSGPGHTDEDED